MAESVSQAPEVADAVAVDTERVQFAAMLAPFLNEALTGDTPVDELKARLRTALGGGTDGETELVVALQQEQSVGVQAESAQEDPRLTNFKGQFNALSEDERKNFTWEQVLRVAGSVDSLLESASKLNNAQVFEVDENNNLVFCDGGDEVPNSTLGQNYFTCRNAAHEAGLELFSEAEYRRLQGRSSLKYEKRMITWLESGENPSFALGAYWDRGGVYVSEDSPRYGYDPRIGDYVRGARRLLRVKLKLKS